MARLASRLHTATRPALSPVERLIGLRYLLARTRLDEAMTIRAARAAGLTWREIGEHLHMTESGARRKYTAQGIQ